MHIKIGVVGLGPPTAPTQNLLAANIECYKFITLNELYFSALKSSIPKK